MDQLLEAIRNATATDATDEVRAEGAQACRTILTALEAKPGESLAQPPQDASPMQTIVAALRGVPPEQLLDLAIARLRAALPPDAALPAVQPMKMPILPLDGIPTSPRGRP